VILLHGLPGSAAAWGEVQRELAQHCQVLAPDLLGFGASSYPRAYEELWADAQADALIEVLERLGVEPAAVVGHDFGGPVALCLYRKRPDLVPRLALSATNAFTDTPIPLPISAVTWPLVGSLFAHALLSGPALRQMLRQGAGKPRPRLDPGVYLGDGGQQRTIRTIFSTSLRELAERYRTIESTLPQVQSPGLVVWGDSDPFFPLKQGERTVAALPDARLVVYEGCGHFVPGERPSRFAADIRALLEQPSTTL
jgi:pimeloyl-ACP methyl ester carboxylesterase